MSEYYQKQVESVKRIFNTLEIKKKSKMEIVELASALGTQTMGTKESLVNNMAHKVASLLLEDGLYSEKYTAEDYMQMPKFRTMAENSKEFFKLVIKNYKKQLKRGENKEAEPQPAAEPAHSSTNITKPYYSFNPTYQNYNFIPLVQNNMNFNGATGYHFNPMAPPQQNLHSVSSMPVITPTSMPSMPIVGGYPSNLGFPDQLYGHPSYPYLNSPYSKLANIPQFLSMGFPQATHPQQQFAPQLSTTAVDPRLVLANPSLNPLMYQHILNKQHQAMHPQKTQEPPKVVSHPEPAPRPTIPPKEPAKPQYIPAPVKPSSSTELLAGEAKCICNGDVEISQISTRKLFCQNCRGIFHQECMKMADADECDKSSFECPSCTLRIMDPLREMSFVLKEDIINFEKLKDKTYITHLKVDKYADVLKQQDKTIEIRCLKLDGVNQYDISWPDCASLRINDEKPTEFKPLQYLSSVKKRKDNAVIVDNALTKGSGYNLLIRLEMKPVTKELLRNYRINEGSLYAIGIYIVSKLSGEALIKSISSVKSEAEEGKRLIINNLAKHRDSEVEIQMLSISLNDPFNLERLKLPARGKYCEHPQCFSLDTFVLLMSHTPFPNWRCPICRRRCFSLKIDTYIQDIIEQTKRTGQQINEISFDIDGNYFFSKIKPGLHNEEQSCKQEKEIKKIQFD